MLKRLIYHNFRFYLDLTNKSLKNSHISLSNDQFSVCFRFLPRYFVVVVVFSFFYIHSSIVVTIVSACQPVSVRYILYEYVKSAGFLMNGLRGQQLLKKSHSDDSTTTTTNNSNNGTDTGDGYV